ncbi:MAG: hypothetical protein WCJ55_12395 [Chloroflexales bacterium]
MDIDPSPIKNTQPFFYAAQIWWFILGLLIFGAFGLAMFVLGSSLATSPFGIVGVAVVMALLTGGPAIWAMRRGKIALGSGLLVGYAIAAVASGGQCTFLAALSGYDSLSGLMTYVYTIGLALVVGVIAAIISAIAGWRKDSL